MSNVECSMSKHSQSMDVLESASAKAVDGEVITVPKRKRFSAMARASLFIVATSPEGSNTRTLPPFLPNPQNTRNRVDSFGLACHLMFLTEARSLRAGAKGAVLQVNAGMPFRV